MAARRARLKTRSPRPLWHWIYPQSQGALAAAAVALAAKDHALTADEEQQLKTRLQYRLYQRNHRAKKQRHAEQLVAELAALRRQVTGLERQRQTLRLQVISQIISGLVAAFRSPDPSSSVRTGESRLREMLSENPPAERMVGQWRRLCDRFRKWDLEITNTDVVLVQDTRVLLVSSPLSLRLFATRDELAAEFPALTERSLELLAARESITIHGRAAIRLDSTTRLVHSWALDLDLIASLQLLTQEPLQEIERIVSCSQSLRDTASDLKEMPKDELTRESEPHRNDCLRGAEPEVRRLSVDKLQPCTLWMIATEKSGARRKVDANSVRSYAVNNTVPPSHSLSSSSRLMRLYSIGNKVLVVSKVTTAELRRVGCSLAS